MIDQSRIHIMTAKKSRNIDYVALRNCEIGEDVRPSEVLKDKCIGSRASGQNIMARTTVQSIIPGSAEQGITCRASCQNVIPPVPFTSSRFQTVAVVSTVPEMRPNLSSVTVWLGTNFLITLFSI